MYFGETRSILVGYETKQRWWSSLHVKINKELFSFCFSFYETDRKSDWTDFFFSANGFNWIRQPSTLKTFPFTAPDWCINLLLLFTVHLQPFKHRQNRFPFDNCLTDSMRREMCLIHLVSKTRTRDDDWWKLTKFFARPKKANNYSERGLNGAPGGDFENVCNAILNRNIFHKFLSAQHKFK